MKKKKLSLLSGLMMIALASIILVSCKSSTAQSTDTDAKQAETTEESCDFEISLAQWSLHKTFFGGPITDWMEFGRLLMEDPDALLKGPDPMDFPKMAAAYGIKTIELVNTFYFSKAKDMAYWEEFKRKCDEAGVEVGLIMCDALGNLGDADPEVRAQTVKNHHAWVDVAKYLGAKTIRVNAAGDGTPEEVAANAADGLTKLGEYGASQGIGIVVENHGGYSSDGKWLSGLMETVNMDNVGTLPDFGNFCIERGPDGCLNQYDTYLGMKELMPYARGVSAKSNEFHADGYEVDKDFLRLMKIVKEAGFKGYVGIEYEGSTLTEDEGIRTTKALLEKVFQEI